MASNGHLLDQNALDLAYFKQEDGVRAGAIQMKKVWTKEIGVLDAFHVLQVT